MSFTLNLEKTMANLHKQVNTMTISWGNIGFEWNRPIFVKVIAL